jgi:2-polyprenyl-6-hydroxyphenyl methylase/3-demethylubiquinone-9 3-methyltransferase
MGKLSLPPKLPVHACKVCRAPAPWIGACDFAKSCSQNWRLKPAIGVDVHYHRCPSCGLVFSPSFDQFSLQEWKTHIYNDEYLAIDPDYTGKRGELMAQTVAARFSHAPGMAVIDYGCGMGIFGARLAALNWPNVTSFDPYVPEFSRRPAAGADLVVACEVLEHAHNPMATFADMASLRTDRGLIMATLLIPPPEETASILDWWYVAPRNGHVTIHSRKSLLVMADQVNLRVGIGPSETGGYFIYFWRQKPDWAATMLPD